jgi:hypothetical protein
VCGAEPIRCRQSLHGTEGCSCLRVAAELGFEVALEEQEDGIVRILAGETFGNGGGALVFVVVGAQVLGETEAGFDGGDLSVLHGVLDLTNSSGLIGAGHAEKESERLDNERECANEIVVEVESGIGHERVELLGA